MKISYWIVRVAILSISVFTVNSYAGAALKSLEYEPASVELEGTLVEKTFYGPPGYGEDPAGDSREKQYLLKLKRPVSVTGSAQSEFNAESETNVSEITLVVLDFKKIPAKVRLGHKVIVTGSLFHAQTGHHHTKVLITVSGITNL